MLHAQIAPIQQLNPFAEKKDGLLVIKCTHDAWWKLITAAPLAFCAMRCHDLGCYVGIGAI
jgi:hypothetical protein